MWFKISLRTLFCFWVEVKTYKATVTSAIATNQICFVLNAKGDFTPFNFFYYYLFINFSMKQTLPTLQILTFRYNAYNTGSHYFLSYSYLQQLKVKNKKKTVTPFKTYLFSKITSNFSYIINAEKHPVNENTQQFFPFPFLLTEKWSLTGSLRSCLYKSLLQE